MLSMVSDGTRLFWRDVRYCHYVYPQPVIASWLVNAPVVGTLVIYHLVPRHQEGT